MFGDFGDTLSKKKNRPYIIAGIIFVGGFILLLLFRNMGGGGTQVVRQGPSEQLQAAQLQANTQLQALGIQAGLEHSAQQNQLAIATMKAELEAQGIGAALAGLEQQLQTQLAIADIQSGDEMAVALAGIQAQENLAAMQHESEMRALSVQENLALEAYETQQHIATTNAQTAIYQTQTAGEVALGTAQLSANLQQAIAGYNAETTQSQIEWAGRSEIAGYDANVMMAQIAQENLTTQTKLISEAMIEQARYEYKAEKSSGLFGAIGSIFGGLFSDFRLKENIEWLGERPDGLSMYGYNYTGDTAPQAGVMAQEVENVYPLAVSEIDGYKAVDYERLAA